MSGRSMKPQLIVTRQQPHGQGHETTLAQVAADEFGVPLLGQIPLEMQTREGGDAGVPVTVGHPDSAQVEAFRSIASAAVARVQAVAGLKLPDLR